MKKQKTDLSGFSSSRNQAAVIAEPDGAFVAEICFGADEATSLPAQVTSRRYLFLIIDEKKGLRQ